MLGTTVIDTVSSDGEEPPAGEVVDEGAAFEPVLPPQPINKLSAASRHTKGIKVLLFRFVFMNNSATLKVISRYRPVRQFTMGQRPV